MKPMVWKTDADAGGVGMDGGGDGFIVFQLENYCVGTGKRG